jgi:hypothetical protein
VSGWNPRSSYLAAQFSSSPPAHTWKVPSCRTQNDGPRLCLQEHLHNRSSCCCLGWHRCGCCCRGGAPSLRTACRLASHAARAAPMPDRCGAAAGPVCQPCARVPVAAAAEVQKRHWHGRCSCWPPSAAASAAAQRLSAALLVLVVLLPARCIHEPPDAIAAAVESEADGPGERPPAPDACPMTPPQKLHRLRCCCSTCCCSVAGSWSAPRLARARASWSRSSSCSACCSCMTWRGLTASRRRRFNAKMRSVTASASVRTTGRRS